MIISAIKTNFASKTTNNVRQKQNFTATKPMAKDSFACSKPSFKGNILTRSEILEATIKSLQEDIVLSKQGIEPKKLPELFFKKAEMELGLGRKKEALRSLNEVANHVWENLKKNPKGNREDCLSILKQKADFEIKYKLKRNAIRTLKQIVKLEPKNKYNHFDLINMQIAYQNNEGAHKSLKIATHLFPKNLNLLENKAYFEENILKNPEESVKTLSEMIKINPYTPDFFQKKAKLEEKTKGIPVAIKTLGEGILANPKAKQLYNKKAILEETTGNLDAVLKTYDDAITANPKEIDFYNYKANVHIFLRDGSSAIETLAEGIKQNPQEKSLYMRKFSLEIVSKDTFGAMDTLDEAIKNNPKEEYFYAQKANLEHVQNNLTAAVKTLTQGIEHGVKKPEILYNNRASYKIEQRKLTDAEKDLDMALSRDPDNAIRSFALLNKGIIRQLEGDREGRTDFFDRALTVDPENNLAVQSLYKVTHDCLVDGEVEKANKILEGIVKKRPNDITVHITKIHVNMASGNVEEALKSFTPLRKKYPESPFVLSYSAALNAEAGKIDIAMNDLSESMKYLGNQNGQSSLDNFIINNLNKFTEKKIQGEEVKFPTDFRNLLTPKYEPESKFDWDNKTEYKPDWDLPDNYKPDWLNPDKPDWE